MRLYVPEEGVRAFVTFPRGTIRVVINCPDDPRYPPIIRQAFAELLRLVPPAAASTSKSETSYGA
jgi:hypothetical protein